MVRSLVLGLTPDPGEAEAAAHPQDRASCAPCTSGSLWCRSRWHGPPRAHGAPFASAPQRPSGSHRASFSWSTAPMRTTRSFHIALAGRARRERERTGLGSHLLLWPRYLRGASPTCSLPGARDQRQKLSLGSAQPHRAARPPPGVLDPLPTVPTCRTRTAALRGAVGSCGALRTGRVAAALVQIQALLTLSAEVVAETGLAVLNLAF